MGTLGLRALPSIDRLLGRPELADLQSQNHDLVVQAAREELEEWRERVRRGEQVPPIEALARAVAERATGFQTPSLRPVINATGVILHTNLGRAPLSADAIAAMEGAARGYSNLEFDLAEGQRGSRHTHVAELLRRVTGAADGLAVNNNAAAVMMVLAAFAQGREVVISRGQLVEIGGGFRIPDVLAQSGARLVEVGTTNRTHLEDYERAVTPETAALLHVHASNFRITGFTETVSVADLAGLARSRRVLLLDDLGSGALLDTARYGLSREPMVQESIRAGVDLAMFSGDKLLGGPQAGIVVGKRELVERLRRHPLARALRPDKGTIAALNATLLHYLRGEAEQKIPIWQMVACPVATLEERARKLAAAIGEKAGVRDGRSMVGGGSLPEESLPTKLVAVASPVPDRLAAALRRGSPPLVARVEEGRVMLDVRTMSAEEVDSAAGLVSAALAAESAAPA